MQLILQPVVSILECTLPITAPLSYTVNMSKYSISFISDHLHRKTSLCRLSRSVRCSYSKTMTLYSSQFQNAIVSRKVGCDNHHMSRKMQTFYHLFISFNCFMVLHFYGTYTINPHALFGFSNTTFL